MLIGGLLMSMWGCMKDDVNIDSEKLGKFDRPLNIAAPLAKVNINASDLLNRLSDSISDFLFIDDDGLLNAQYHDSVNIVWDDIVKVDSVSYQQSFPIIIPPGSSSPTESYTYIEKIKINAEDYQRFDSMIIQSALLSLDVELPSELSGNVNITFPEISKDGEILQIDYNSQSGITHFENDLQDAHVHFKQATDSSYITVEITPSNVQASGTTGGIFSLEFSFILAQVVPDITFGDFGSSKVIDQSNSMKINFFDDLEILGKVEFYDLQLDLVFDNYYGVNYTCEIDSAIVKNTNTQDTLSIKFKDTNTLNVYAANYSNEIDPTLNTQRFDNTNSNLQDAVQILPNQLLYHVNVTTDAADPGEVNFVTQKNKIVGLVNVNVPLWFRTQAYERIDTIKDFDINDMISDDNMDYLEKMELTFDFENRFPFDLDVQVYVTKENFEIVDSIFTDYQQFLVAGVLDENQKVIEPTETEDVVVEMTKEQVQFYKDNDVKSMLVKSKTITALNGTEFVKIYDSYGLSFKVDFEIISNTK